jgi:hypothetical protein
MVTHRWWGNKFCKRTCKDAYLRELALDRDKIRRWYGFPSRGDSPSCGRCLYRKLDSTVMVMKTAEDRSRCDDSEALNRARERGIFAQRAMNSRSAAVP